MMLSDPTVFVVDDEKQSRDSVCALVRSMGVPAEGFESGEEFLEQYRGQAGCVVTDYRMHGMSGLQLQDSLIKQGNELPLIVVTAYAHTPMTVQAIKNGAVTLIDKPYDHDNLWKAIRIALKRDSQQRQQKSNFAEIRLRLKSLSGKEQAVLDYILEGTTNKSMSSKLDVSLRTIENRRRKIFSKLRVDSVAELVKIVLESRAPQR